MTDAATSRYSQYLIPLVKPFSNFDVPFIASFRRSAIAHLELRKGDRVVDVGCGSGGSFRHLRGAVGDDGDVVGVELSPSVAALAKRRVAKNQWRNVKVIEGPAQTARLDGLFDAAIMFGANEIFTLKEAVENIFMQLKPGGRVVVMGAKLAEGGPARALNPLFRTMTSALMLPSTPTMTSKPFALLQDRMAEFHIRELAGGLLFVIWGTIKT